MRSENVLTKKQVGGNNNEVWRKRFLFLMEQAWFQAEADWHLHLPETEHMGQFEEELTKAIDLRINHNGETR